MEKLRSRGTNIFMMGTGPRKKHMAREAGCSEHLRKGWALAVLGEYAGYVLAGPWLAFGCSFSWPIALTWKVAFVTA